VGCNFACLFCQNWTLSCSRPDDTVGDEIVQPEEIVAMAKQQKIPIISYTYNEPTIFYEYMIDTAKLAKKAGIKNVIVSNGYIQQEPLKELCKYIDAANIDLKAFNEDFYKKIVHGNLAPVLETLKTLKKEGVWLEITNLIIPTLNDNFEEIEQMCRWIKENLGQTVLHFSRFFPHHKLNKLPATPPQTLDKARKIALKHLDHVYVGNIQTEANNTYCPKCKTLLIERSWFTPSLNEIKNGKCPNCGREIIGVWNK
jgi:pyruvate formate lyase activating enzyme